MLKKNSSNLPLKRLKNQKKNDFGGVEGLGWNWLGFNEKFFIRQSLKILTMGRQKRKKTSPIFFEFSEMETDVWWKEKFLEFAEGYFPNHLNFSGSSFFYKVRGKVFTFLFDPNIPKETLLIKLKKFLQDVVGIIPDTSIENLDDGEVFLLTWDILNKKPCVREIAIWNYLKTQNLNSSEFEKRRKTIWWGFVKGIWNENTFKIENNQIVSFDMENSSPSLTRHNRELTSIPKLSLGRIPGDDFLPKKIFES